MLTFFPCYLVSSDSHRKKKIIKALSPSERWRASNNFLPKPAQVFQPPSVAVKAKHTASDMQWQMSFIKLNTKHSSTTKTERYSILCVLLDLHATLFEHGAEKWLIVGKCEAMLRGENNLWVYTDNQDVWIGSYHWRKKHASHHEQLMDNSSLKDQQHVEDYWGRTWEENITESLYIDSDPTCWIWYVVLITSKQKRCHRAA